MPYILNKYYPTRNIFFAVGEGVIILSSIIFASYLYYGPKGFIDDMGWLMSRSLLVTIIAQLWIYFFDLYDFTNDSVFSDVAIRLTQALGFTCIVLACVYFLFPTVMIEPKILLAGYAILFVSITGWRLFYKMVLDKKMFTQAILLVGTGELAEIIARDIETKKDSGFKIVGYVGDTKPVYNPRKLPLFPFGQDLRQVVRDLRAEKIVVALDDRRGKMPVEELLVCRVAGIPVIKVIDFYEGLTGKIMVEKTNPSWLIFSQGFNQSRLYLALKRIVDISAAFIGLGISLPILIITAILIKFDSKGPIFYSQKRVGEKNKAFMVIKFRSMRTDAETNGPVWAQKNDKRVTRVGNFIRKTRIDEIPQMWTVLKGDMSFVGPRPERPEFVEQLEKIIPYYSLRHTIKPGITGWAQICFPYGASEEDAVRKLEYDLYYLKNMNLLLDVSIIFRTIKTVLFKKGGW